MHRIKPQSHLGSPSFCTGKINIAVHQLHISFYDIQAQSGALNIRGVGRPEKPGKKVLLVCFRDAHALIDHPERGFILLDCRDNLYRRIFG